MAEFKVGDKVALVRAGFAEPYIRLAGKVGTVTYRDDSAPERNLEVILTVQYPDGTSTDAFEHRFDAAEEPSAIDHPAHYTFGKYEVLDVIEDWELDMHLGNAVKYIARAGRKDVAKEIEDLNKAVFYLNRKIKLLEASNGNN